MRVFHFVIKKRKRALRPDSFFFLMILTFFKNILILIITSLAIHYSQNVFRGFSIFVCIGLQVFFRGFVFSLLLSRVTRSRARESLRLTEKR